MRSLSCHFLDYQWQVQQAGYQGTVLPIMLVAFILSHIDEPFFVIVPKGHHFEELDAVTPQLLSEEQVLLL